MGSAPTRVTSTPGSATGRSPGAGRQAPATSHPRSRAASASRRARGSRLSSVGLRTRRRGERRCVAGGECIGRPRGATYPSPVRVVHISDSDLGGGAAQTAFAIHTGLRRLGHDSRMLVGRPVSGDRDVRSIKRNRAWRAADRAAGEILDRLSLQYVFYPSSFAVTRDPWFRQADVVQLYNLHGSYFSFTALPQVTRSRPAFWVLQDQWALTGHVAYSLDCSRWQSGCGACPYLREYPPLRRDTSALLWRLKARVLARSRLTLVVPSRWLERQTRSSPLLRRFPVHRIPRGIDTHTFTPGSQTAARERLGLPAARPIVFFSALDLDDRRKGLRHLVAGWRRLEPRPLLLLAGDGAPPPDVEARSLGLVHDRRVLADAYRAADVYAVPTEADVQTKTAPEALACGTPCVSFDEGGVTDVVRDGETGLHARLGDEQALAGAVQQLLDDSELRERLGRRGRQVAEEEFSVELTVARHAALLESALAA
jgi:glycosyltransferase involved in cell wall biosynthesis